MEIVNEDSLYGVKYVSAIVIGISLYHLLGCELLIYFNSELLVTKWLLKGYHIGVDPMRVYQVIFPCLIHFMPC